MKQLKAEDVRAWIDSSPSFEYAEVGAAIGLTLIDELFEAGKFDRDAFSKALGGRRVRPGSATGARSGTER